MYFSFRPPPLHWARLRALGLTWLDLTWAHHRAGSSRSNSDIINRDRYRYQHFNNWTDVVSDANRWSSLIPHKKINPSKSHDSTSNGWNGNIECLALSSKEDQQMAKYVQAFYYALKPAIKNIFVSPAQQIVFSPTFLRSQMVL